MRERSVSPLAGEGFVQFHHQENWEQGQMPWGSPDWGQTGSLGQRTLGGGAGWLSPSALGLGRVILQCQPGCPGQISSSGLL